MTHRTPATGAAAPVVPCRRLDAAFTVATHLECLYCAGDAAAVATGDHAAFCTFRPGVDPVCFGFPDALRDTLPTPRALPPPAPVAVPCRRVDAAYDVAGHQDCPYCCGAAADVAAGDHARFCTFDPTRDPIAFGFPDDFGRQTYA